MLKLKGFNILIFHAFGLEFQCMWFSCGQTCLLDLKS